MRLTPSVIAALLLLSPLARGQDCADAVQGALRELDPRFEGFNRSELANAVDYSAFIQTALKDRANGPRKVKTLLEFGFQANLAQKEVTSFPSWMEAASKYKHLLDQQGIPESERIYPAVVFYRFKADGTREYRLINPVREELPPDDFKILTFRQQFNIPFKAILDGLKQGKFPMMGPSHDTAHFIAFAQNSWIMKALRESASKIDPQTASPALKRRFYYVLETASIPRLEKPEELESLINSVRPERISTPNASFASLRQSLDSVDEKAFLAYADKLGLVFESSLKDVSGSATQSREFAAVLIKKLLDTPVPLNSPSDIYKFNSVSSGEINEVTQYLERTLNFYRRNGPLAGANIFPPTPREVSLLSLKTVAVLQRLTRNLIKRLDLEGPEGASYGNRKALSADLRDLTAMLEYSFIAFNKTGTPEQFYREMLSPEVSPDSFSGRYLREVFNNDVIGRYYLGAGEKRR